MNQIIQSYLISSETMALLPANESDYDTIVIEENDTKYVQQTHLDIIDFTSLELNFTTYEGRWKAIQQLTNFKENIPIPINLHLGIYFFPTHSPKDKHNYWISFKHVLSMEEVSEQQGTTPAQSIIYFKNKQSLTLNVSIHDLKKQYKRMLEVVLLIEKNNKA